MPGDAGGLLSGLLLGDLGPSSILPAGWLWLSVDGMSIVLQDVLALGLAAIELQQVV